MCPEDKAAQLGKCEDTVKGCKVKVGCKYVPEKEREEKRKAVAKAGLKGAEGGVNRDFLISAALFSITQYFRYVP